MEHTFRLATKEDLEWILSGQKRVYLEEEEEFVEMEEKRRAIKSILNDKTWILQVGEERAGFISYSIDQKCPFGLNYSDWENMYIWIDYVYVEVSFRRRGFGKLLLHQIEEIGKSKGIPEILLDISEKNSSSRDFHLSLDFKPIYTIYQKTI